MAWTIKCRKDLNLFLLQEGRFNHFSFVLTGKAEQAQINSDPKGVEYDRYNLEWSARSVSPISNFKVEWKTLGDEKWKETEVEAYPMPNSDNSYAGTHMITKLNPATVYLVKVSSKNVYGYSNPSQAFKFATRGAGNWQITHFQYSAYCKGYFPSD